MSQPNDVARPGAADPLDTPFGEFRLSSNGRIYTVFVERIHCEPLNHGLYEWSYMDPEDCPEELQDHRQRELRTIERLEVGLSFAWPHWKTPTLLTPPPDWRSPELQDPARWQGNLCAAILCSHDDFFPVPYRDDDGVEQPADCSEAHVVYTTLLGEGLLPERIRSIIDWERVARPAVF